jgi:hypothetical protein
MTPEAVKKLVLERLSEWSLDLTQYDVQLFVKNEYTGSYRLELRHKPSGRVWAVPHIFVNEQTTSVSWSNIEMNQQA